jgi:hypothetical protein
MKFLQTEANLPLTDHSSEMDAVSGERLMKMVKFLRQTDNSATFCRAARSLGAAGDLASLPNLIDALEKASKAEVPEVCMALLELMEKNPGSPIPSCHQNRLIGSLRHWKGSAVAADIAAVVQVSGIEPNEDVVSMMIGAFRRRMQEGSSWPEREAACINLCNIKDERAMDLLLDLIYDGLTTIYRHDVEDVEIEEIIDDILDMEKIICNSLSSFGRDALYCAIDAYVALGEDAPFALFSIFEEDKEEAIRIFMELYLEKYVREPRWHQPDYAFIEEKRVVSALLRLGATQEEIAEAVREEDEDEEPEGAGDGDFFQY